MLKLKDGFILREIGGDIMATHSGEELDLNMMITLNETGAFLWQRLQEETTEEAMLKDMLEEYEVEEATARKCITEFLEKLNEYGFLTK